MIFRAVINGFVNDLGPCKVMPRQHGGDRYIQNLREQPFFWFNFCSSAEPVAQGLFSVALGLFMCLYRRWLGLGHTSWYSVSHSIGSNWKLAPGTYSLLFFCMGRFGAGFGISQVVSLKLGRNPILTSDLLPWPCCVFHICVRHGGTLTCPPEYMKVARFLL